MGNCEATRGVVAIAVQAFVSLDNSLHEEGCIIFLGSDLLGARVAHWYRRSEQRCDILNRSIHGPYDRATVRLSLRQPLVIPIYLFQGMSSDYRQ